MSKCPIAFLLTFRTYGTWVHGDDRGSVDREHNVYGTAYARADRRRERQSAERMRDDALTFDDRQRSIVEDALRDECACRGWDLVCCAVQTNHCHVVVRYADESPERMCQRLKARATRWLRERGGLDAKQPVWVNGSGSRRWLWHEGHLRKAIEYVMDGQDTPR